jgi:hypothetical protein
VTTLHVQNQIVTRETYRRWAKARDVVLVADHAGQPIDGALVTVRYYGPGQGQLSGTTGADGTVVLDTPWIRKPKGLWCFRVLDVAKAGTVYDPLANVVTVQCEAN